MTMLYQRRTLAPAADVGQPGPLPVALRGLSDASLADLPAALNADAVTKLDLANTGFVPVAIEDVPPAVSRLQFITALQNAGAYSAVRTAILALPPTSPISIYFLNTARFDRADPRLLAFAAAMTQTAAQVDAYFIAAGLIAA